MSLKVLQIIDESEMMFGTQARHLSGFVTAEHSVARARLKRTANRNLPLDGSRRIGYHAILVIVFS